LWVIRGEAFSGVEHGEVRNVVVMEITTSPRGSAKLEGPS
jgi:predicted RNA-binding protein with TRAM domain